MTVEPSDAPTPVPKPKRRGRRLLGGLLAAVLLGALMIAAGTFWAVGTESGSAWTLSRLPGVRVEAPRGTLAGEFSAQRLVVDLPGGKDRVTLTGVGWRGVSVRGGDGTLWARLTIDALFANRVDVVLAPKPPQADTPSRPPADLKLPVEIELKSVKVGEIRATPLGDGVVSGLDTALHLGADAGAVHRIDRLALRFGAILLGGKAQVASAAPMALETTVDASQAAAGNVPAWAAQLRLAGPLAEPLLEATLRASPVLAASASASASAASSAAPAAPAADRAQSLDLRATLRPFAPWPLGDLAASTRALDLSAFVATAPSTALDIEARATSSGVDRPAVITLDVANAAPGRYDEARLPLQSLRAEVAVRPDRATEVEVRSATAVLGSPREGGGRISLQGTASPDRWRFEATLDALAPQRLDNRAPPLLLSGPVTAAGGAAAVDGKGIDLKTTLTGRLNDAGTERPVALRLDASFDLAAATKRLHVALLEAAAGDARLKAAGTATQADAGAPWVLKADAALADFDPGAWIGGSAGAPWRGTRNRVNAKLAVDGSAALPAAGASALDALAASRGHATVALDGSVLADVPLAGTVALQSNGEQAHVVADLASAGNSLRADGRLATRGKGSADAVDLVLDARSLAALAPVYKLFLPAGADATLAGRVTARARLDGRWPKLATRGDLDAQGLRVGPTGLARATGRWTAGTAPTDRVALDLSIDRLTTQPKGAPPGPSLETVVVQLAGTARAHTLDLRLGSRARPPAWAEAATQKPAAVATASPASAPTSAPATSSGSVAPATRLTVATLRARGGLVDQKEAALSGWRGTLQSVDVASNDGAAAPLLRARDISLEACWGVGPLRAVVQPGRIELAGGALRWTRLRYAAAAAGALPRIDVDATIEPLRVAPLLAQAQPGFGWGGDLALGGRVRLVTGDTGLQADALIERSGGDLTITDELATRPLGLSELRVALKADRGVWNVSTRIVGRTLGTATADATVRGSPQLLVPAADAPLGGRVDLDIADLAGLAAWVPPGWRVGGALRASATLGGRLGQPDYDGQIVGRQITARNFLEGFSATDGDLLVKLAGKTATLDHFTVKGGDGSLRVTGDATFDAAPVVRLDVTATKFQVLGRIDRKIVASGQAKVGIDAGRVAVSGRFGVDQGLIDITRSDAPALADDVTVVRAAGVLSPAAAASAAESPGGNAPLPIAVAAAAAPTTDDTAVVRAVDLDVALDLGRQLAIRGHGLAARLGGTLRVTSPASKVAINGTVDVVDGTFKAYGQDLVIDRGAIVFTGAVDRPRLDIEATRPKLENLRVGVTITGSAANPRIRLFSEPALSEVDKLSYLVVGRGADDLGRNESALLQSAAMALVSGEGNGEPGITDRVTKALGLDELSLGQTTDGTVKQTVVTLGKQLSDRWSIGYQAGLNAAAGSVQLVYKVARRLTVRAQAGTASALDLIWSWRWQ